MSENKTSNIKQFWDNTLTEIELTISKANFTTWFKNTELIKEEGGIVYLGVPNEFVKNWLYDKYNKLILKLFRNLSENIRGVEYVVIPKNEKVVFDVQTKKPSINNKFPLQDLYIHKESNLNPKYTFDSFVVGKFNELGHAAAQAIVKTPGIAYNPLFIYGKTGLGKTHLLQAIGNAIRKKYSDKKVYYITAEKYFLDYINSVQSNKISIFKEKYRKYDVFIMDDIQIFEKKKGTQEELFHLFNTLYDNNKQIVFSSDKHYNYIPEIEDRLKSRFGAGMIVDISYPDFESKVAILKHKARSLNFLINDEIIEFIAHTINSSIRELEGILNIIICQSQLKNRNLELNEIKNLIKNNEKPRKTVSIDDVINIVSDFYKIEKNDIYKKTRRKEIVKPRQIVMYLLREDFNISYPTIGQKLGGRDHTTVIHSCEKIRNLIKINTILSQDLDNIRAMF